MKKTLNEVIQLIGLRKRIKTILLTMNLILFFLISVTLSTSGSVYSQYVYRSGSKVQAEIEETALSESDQPRTKTITGRVLDNNRQPLIGATVVVKGTTTGTITDFNGAFTLSVPTDAQILVISYIGMKSQEIDITDKISVNLIMEEAAIGIEEVVAIGYGSVRKSDLTGSVSKVIMEDTERKAGTSFEQMIQGQLSGVMITSNTGAPGSGMTFSIRGITSIRGDNQPLIVIDGYPLESNQAVYQQSGGSQSGYIADIATDNPLANLNPNDIESIEILKDASSAAIYGSRASNGVVLITTKSGKSGRNLIDYTFRSDLSKLPKMIDVLNSLDYMNYSNEAYLHDNRDSIFTAAQYEFYKENTNWQELAYRTAFTHNHNLNISGGDDKTRYSINFGLMEQEGIVKNTRYDRGSLRINLDKDYSSRLKFGINMSATMSKNKSIMQSSSRTDASMSVVSGALTNRPMDTPWTEDDEIDQTQIGNVYTLIQLCDDQNRVTSALANMFMDYTLMKGLFFRIRGGVNATSSHRDYYQPRGTSLGNLEGGYAYRGHGGGFNYLTEYTLNFNREFNVKHRINAVAGYTWQDWKNRSFTINVLNFPNDNLLHYDLSSGTTVNNPISTTSLYSLASFLSRVNYSFDNRYLLTLTGRYDGSTRLAKGNKWDFFPSMALGWNLHNEAFMQNIDFLSEAKIRASYGFSGSQSIGIGATKERLSSTYSVANQSIVIGYYPAAMGNPDLKWERTAVRNVGLDLSFLERRISLSVEYYNKLTKNLLMALPIPVSSGYGSYSTNFGSVENTGIDVDAMGRILTGKFRWDLRGNISFNRNKVLDLGELDYLLGGTWSAINGQNLSIAQVGHPIGAFYGYRINGLYQNAEEVAAGPTDASIVNQPGFFKFVDISGPDGVPDGKIDLNDREIIGNPYPDYIFGITNNFEWKGLSLNIFVQASIGQDVINAFRHTMDALSRISGSNLRQDAYDNRWTGERTSNYYPKANSLVSPFASRFTDFIVEDASYIRLKNVTLAYNFAGNKIQFARRLDLFVSAANLYTITNYKGYDPEINARGANALLQGIDSGSIPQYRTFSLGINVGF